MSSPSWGWRSSCRYRGSGGQGGCPKEAPPPSLTLPRCLQKSRHTESEKLQVQIQAYLDNVFDVGGLLEDAETKNVALEKVEELEEHLSHVCERGGTWGCSSARPGASPPRVWLCPWGDQQ